MVRTAARQLGVPAADCVLIGDIGADVQAALQAGARAVLVPTPETRPAEVAHARTSAAVADDLLGAVSYALTGRRMTAPRPLGTGTCSAYGSTAWAMYC